MLGTSKGDGASEALRTTSVCKHLRKTVRGAVSHVCSGNNIEIAGPSLEVRRHCNVRVSIDV